MKAGDTLEVLIEKAVYRGQGLARHDGQVVLVGRGAPGDRLRVRVREVHRGYATALIEERLSPGPGRRLSPCPYFDRCGGCAYQDLEYPIQLRLKEAVLRDALARAGVPWEGELEVRPSPETGWRTRASLHVHASAEGVRLGLFEEGSRRVVDLPECLQLSSAMNRAQRGLARSLAENPQWSRRVFGLDLAEAVDGSEVVATLLAEMTPREAAGLRAVGEGLPWLTGLAVLAGRGRQKRFLSLAGRPFLEHSVGGFRLRAHARSFFQSNRFLVEDLAGAVAALLPEGGRILDLYAGVGLFSLVAGRHAESVIGLELNPHAVEDAQANARRAGFRHVRIRRTDVGVGLRDTAPAPAERVILDPPRTGAGPELVRALAARRPEVIVYVSCDPPTLGRDLAQFAGLGYRVDALVAFDLFPDTFHLETVARLTRASE